MVDQFSRTEMLIGEENLQKLKKAKVAIFGIGGVGTFVAEALARSGIGAFVLIDNDKVSITNINRQLIATTKTIGEYKVDLMKKRILEINPEAEVKIFKTFYTEETDGIIDETFDYIVDAIDTVSSKIALIENSKRLGIPIISSMGTGNKLDATRFEITDINKTSVCPLAKIIRKELRKRDIKKLKVLYSKEEPVKPKIKNQEESDKKNVPGSIAFVPSVAGLIIAGEIIKELIGE